MRHVIPYAGFLLVLGSCATTARSPTPEPLRHESLVIDHTPICRARIGGQYPVQMRQGSYTLGADGIVVHEGEYDANAGKRAAAMAVCMRQLS